MKRPLPNTPTIQPAEFLRFFSTIPLQRELTFHIEKRKTLEELLTSGTKIERLDISDILPDQKLIEMLLPHAKTLRHFSWSIDVILLDQYITNDELRAEAGWAQFFAQCTALTSARLEGFTISDNTLNSLAENKFLNKSLREFTYTPFSDNDISSEEGIKNIPFADNDISTAGIKNLLEAAKNLKKLQLHLRNIKGEPLSLSENVLKELEMLHIGSETQPDSEVAETILNTAINNAVTLKELRIYEVELDDSIQGQLKKRGQDLEVFECTYQEGFDNEPLVDLGNWTTFFSRCKKLKYVKMQNILVDDKALSSLATHCAESLVDFNYSVFNALCPVKITHAGLQELLEKAHNLLNLDIDFEQSIKGDFNDNFSLSLNETLKLQSLRISNLYNRGNNDTAFIREENIQEIIKKAPNLLNLNIDISYDNDTELYTLLKNIPGSCPNLENFNLFVNNFFDSSDDVLDVARSIFSMAAKLKNLKNMETDNEIQLICHKSDRLEILTLCKAVLLNCPKLRKNDYKLFLIGEERLLPAAFCGKIEPFYIHKIAQALSQKTGVDIKIMIADDLSKIDFVLSTDEQHSLLQIDCNVEDQIMKTYDSIVKQKDFSGINGINPQEQQTSISLRP